MPDFAEPAPRRRRGRPRAGEEGWDVYGPLLIVVAFVVGSVVAASLTLRRRTP